MVAIMQNNEIIKYYIEEHRKLTLAIANNLDLEYNIVESVSKEYNLKHSILLKQVSDYLGVDLTTVENVINLHIQQEIYNANKENLNILKDYLGVNQYA